MRIATLQHITSYLITTASLSDLDTSSESVYDSSQDSASEMDEDFDETLEPKCDAPWDPTACDGSARLGSRLPSPDLRRPYNT
jgi:hypothetical protein